jgi:hypothetical protein
VLARARPTVLVVFLLLLGQRGLRRSVGLTWIVVGGWAGRLNEWLAGCHCGIFSVSVSVSVPLFFSYFYTPV